MTDALQIDVRFLVQLALCSALLTCFSLVAFRRNAVTRRAYALSAGVLLVTLPVVLAVSSAWYWTAPFEVLAVLSLAGVVSVPLWLVGAWAGVAIVLNARAVIHAARSRGRLARLPAIHHETIAGAAAGVASELGFKRPYRLHSTLR